jgi:hypothetical protein
MAEEKQENPVITIIRKEIKNELEKRGIASTTGISKDRKFLNIVNLPMYCRIFFEDNCNVSVQFIKKVGGYGKVNHEHIEFKSSVEICNPKFDPQEIISKIVVLLDSLNAIRTVGSNPDDLTKLPLDCATMKREIKEAWEKVKQNGLAIHLCWKNNVLRAEINIKGSQNSMYLCFKGYKQDGKNYILDAGTGYYSNNDLCYKVIEDVTQHIIDMINNHDNHTYRGHLQ